MKCKFLVLFSHLLLFKRLFSLQICVQIYQSLACSILKGFCHGKLKFSVLINGENFSKNRRTAGRHHLVLVLDLDKGDSSKFEFRYYFLVESLLFFLEILLYDIIDMKFV